MPFPSNLTRFPYTRQAVENVNENQNGVYGIYGQNGWIYVGKGDIRTRMLAHLNGDQPCINRSSPTGWVGMLTPNMDDDEKSLILELDPPCNKRVG